MAKIYRGTRENLQFLARRLRAGELVAVPSETVYGLAADALSARACRKIFQAKGRPASDPLIVHVSSVAQAASIAELSDAARRLMRRYWPGPLTLVLPKKAVVPDIVTAGRPSVAVRMPAHPLFLKLLAETGTPLAAPSANPFGYVSPTTAQHVQDGLGARIQHILDGGPSEIGLESTIVDLRDPQNPRLLRPGQITKSNLEKTLRRRVKRGPAPEPAAHPTASDAPSGAGSWEGSVIHGPRPTAAANSISRAAHRLSPAGQPPHASAAATSLSLVASQAPAAAANSTSPSASPAPAAVPSQRPSPAPGAAAPTASPAGMLAPGMLSRHYSPHTPVIVHRKISWSEVKSAPADTAWVFVVRPKSAHAAKNVFAWGETVDRRRRGPAPRAGAAAAAIARNLFALLRQLDSGPWSSIHVELAPRGGLGDAINDRLTRAASRSPLCL